MPVVSIIIPVHNREDLLPVALDSVKAQTFDDWECIVVDDHSTDCTFSVLERYAAEDDRFKPVNAPADKRYPNAARNFGLGLARGEFVNFLDSDDLFVQNKLQLQLDIFTRDRHLDMVTCQHDLVVEHDGGVETHLMKFATEEYWLDVVWFPDYRKHYGGLWCTNAPLWRKEAIQSIGTWDEDLRAWQDDDLNIRAILQGKQIKRIEEVLVHVRKISADNVNTQSDLKASHILKGLQKSWTLLKDKGEITDFRRRMIALKIMSQARWLVQQRRLVNGLRYWKAGASFTQQPPLRVLQGYLLLSSLYFAHLMPFYHRLHSIFYHHLQLLPDASA